MKRLYKLDDSDLNEWYYTRIKDGAEKYGDKHLKRYNLVDVMEEVMDAHRILDLFQDRLLKENASVIELDDYNQIIDSIYKMKEDLVEMEHRLQKIDINVPDALVTDEEGGERIWW